MRKEIETLYRKLITCVQRFPTTKTGSLNVPVLLACADLPVFKRTKACASQDVRINEGSASPRRHSADSGDGGQAFHLKADNESGRLRTAFR
jgi:hypothetical protein